MMRRKIILIIASLLTLSAGLFAQQQATEQTQPVVPQMQQAQQQAQAQILSANTQTMTVATTQASVQEIVSDAIVRPLDVIKAITLLDASSVTENVNTIASRAEERNVTSIAGTCKYLINKVVELLQLAA